MIDHLFHQPDGPVLIVGGYGTVGAELSALVAAAGLPLLLTGRTPANGAALAERHGASLARWDLRDPAPFEASVRAVVSAVNDPEDRVLRAAVRAGIPYVDITRWTSRLARASVTATQLEPTAPVLLSSAWMGGVVSLVAAALIAELGGAHRVDVAIRYDMADRAGADSVDFVDRLGQDFEVVRGGSAELVRPLTSAGWIDIAGHRTRVAGLDTPEQLTLPITLGVDTVTTRIGFSANSSTAMLLALRRIGFFRWASGPRWKRVRRSMLYAPGAGGTAHLRIDVDGAAGHRTAMVSDPAGQAHLTAVGGFLALQHVLGDAARPGIVFPESVTDPATVLAQLRELEVEVLVS
ncbi:saccharopine dehydrogenase [Plantibacter flavus]|uniref:saccharopine dehydrogenase n=1 Tax=Plantibacter flavus TaxID=150123 RepID=UPI003F13E340